MCMDQVIFGNVATGIAVAASVIAAICAYYSYSLSKSIYDEIKSDEHIAAGRLHHPGLAAYDHNMCVIRCGLFNKSKRKAYIRSVKAFDQDLNQFNITWSGAIDKLGNIQNPTGLLGIEDSIEVYIRSNDSVGFKEGTIIQIEHSFSEHAIELVFDPDQGWW